MAEGFGKYNLLRRIAVGGMAEIFVARHQGMQGFSRKIVIKRIRPHLTDQQSFVQMFLNEAKLASQLVHSNIGQIYDLGRIGNTYFIAMEYVRGRDMRTIVAKAAKQNIPFPLIYSLKVASEVCEGLYYAHRKADDDGRALNIVHRDVTPENLMVSFDGEVKILDFGIAKASNQVSETRVGEIKGKLGYMSPEQVKGKTLDRRSDIFSLGVVMYEWVTGQRLFSEGSDVEILRSVVEGKIYPPSYFKADIPEPVESLIMRALTRNREERFQSAWDLQFDINKFLSKQEFHPSNIHLSNFLRQIFEDAIREEDKLLAQAESDADSENDDVLADETVAEMTAALVTDGSGSKQPGQRQKSDKRLKSDKRRTTDKKAVVSNDDVDVRRNTPTTTDESPDDREPDLLVAELLASQAGFLSVNMEVDREVYERLSKIAARNNITVPALVREVLAQYTRFK